MTTIAKLIEALARMPPDATVVVVYDCGCAKGDIVEVRLTDGGVVQLEVD